MSTTHSGAALDIRADISPTERLLLVLLARDADPEGVAFPGLDQLAAAANISTSAAARVLRRLSALGLVERTEVRTAAGAAAPTAYRVIGGLA
ncbi:helix-turn-helix domain-containing protein [Streptomyces sp. CL12-4]|uniref:helix-turn-helix domain-containing protein n=1 Tax=Streptomyces sp. CL12-4 TaxID=2810306 RepID=UPI001EFA3AD9|nr:helix-turn-helix domain-containing protein [Streptomyces sp. CL12-4]MCG8971859.1 helix-turn-helix domain-containing protein [Streptomyces sp. CL12-4]